MLCPCALSCSEGALGTEQGPPMEGQEGSSSGETQAAESCVCECLQGSPTPAPHTLGWNVACEVRTHGQL